MNKNYKYKEKSLTETIFVINAYNLTKNQKNYKTSKRTQRAVDLIVDYFNLLEV